MPPARKKNKLVPKRHHWYGVLLFIFGTLFPPLAVAARFGIGTDFWLNLLLTICGYIPGHGHNFYIQNIRNNKTKARTPKWAARYGLVDTTTLERKQKRSQWAARYNERNPNSTLEGQQYEEGQSRGPGTDDYGADRPARLPGEGEHDLWNPSEESFYSNEQRASALEGGRSGGWHYPANFNEALPPDEPKRKKSSKSSSKKDRWARTEDAYNKPASSERRKSRRSRPETSSMRTDSTTDIPEDAEGGLYGTSQPTRSNGATYDIPNRDGSRTPPARPPTNEADEFAHTF